MTINELLAKLAVLAAAGHGDQTIWTTVNGRDLAGATDCDIVPVYESGQSNSGWRVDREPDLIPEGVAFVILGERIDGTVDKDLAASALSTGLAQVVKEGRF